MLKKSTVKRTVIEDKGTIRAQRPLHIAADLSWNFGEDVVVYDVRDCTPYVSYYVVASAANETRLRSLVQSAKEALYDNYKELDHVEGRNDSKWVLLDATDVVIQLFTKEERRNVDFDSLYAHVPHKVVVSKEEPKYRRRKKAASQINY